MLHKLLGGKLKCTKQTTGLQATNLLGPRLPKARPGPPHGTMSRAHPRGGPPNCELFWGEAEGGPTRPKGPDPGDPDEGASGPAASAPLQAEEAAAEVAEEAEVATASDGAAWRSPLRRLLLARRRAKGRRNGRRVFFWSWCACSWQSSKEKHTQGIRFWGVLPQKGDPPTCFSLTSELFLNGWFVFCRI